MRSGVVAIFQELSLIPDLTVAENICAPEPPRRFGLIDRRAQRRRAEGLLARVHCEDCIRTKSCAIFPSHAGR